MGLIQSLNQGSKIRPPEQQPVASVAVVSPPATHRLTIDCSHNKTRIVEIRSDFWFDAKGLIHYDRTKPPDERYEECLWCGEWLTIEPETEPEPIVSEPESDCNFAW